MNEILAIFSKNKRSNLAEFSENAFQKLREKLTEMTNEISDTFYRVIVAPITQGHYPINKFDEHTTGLKGCYISRYFNSIYRQRKISTTKATSLKYLEIHLVDHCNLNCKGCGHFSPLSKPNFITTEEFKNDLLQLKQNIIYITQLRLMGGEPFLHPKLRTLLKIARKIYPSDKIAIVTNGILLLKQKKKVLKTIKKLHVEIHITTYPVFEQQTDKYIELLKRFNITYEIEHTNTFYKHINLTKKQDPCTAISKCRKQNYCPALKHGILFQCSGLANMHILVDYFTLETNQLPLGLDIYDGSIDAEKILHFLDSPDPLCSHCFYAAESFNWDRSKNNLNEWVL